MYLQVVTTRSSRVLVYIVRSTSVLQCGTQPQTRCHYRYRRSEGSFAGWDGASGCARGKCWLYLSEQPGLGMEQLAGDVEKLALEGHRRTTACVSAAPRKTVSIMAASRGACVSVCCSHCWCRFRACALFISQRSPLHATGGENPHFSQAAYSRGVHHEGRGGRQRCRGRV